jgi:hypothetical protein
MQTELVLSKLVEISSYPCEFLGLRDLIIFSISFVVENLRFIFGNELSNACDK